MKTNKSNGQLTAQINMGDHKKSGFDLSNNVLGTGKIGRIIPTRALHVMPGDTIKGDSKVAVQFEPLAVPILANMDVKQEHFYVPYNVVWKNWDKFISGGEKLDYNGVAPNVSLARIYDVVFSILDAVSVTAFRSMDLENDPDDRGFFLSSPKDAYNALKSTIEDVGNTYSIKDILQEQIEALELLKELPEMPESLENDEALKYYYFKRVNPEDYDGDFQAMYEALGIKGTKVIDELNLFIQNYIYNSFGNKFVLPTARGLQLLTIMYDYIKSFIGIGSNIDYLNMGRLTYTEYVASMIQKLTVYVIENFQVGDDVKLAIDPNFISNEPLTIFNLRANYNIWYNNYRDILLETDAFEPVDTDEITDTELFTLLVPRQRCWEKDAFTTALDNPGTGYVGVPVGTQGYSIDAYKVSNLLVDSNIQSSSSDAANLDSSSIYKVTIGDKSWNLPTSFLTGINPKMGDDSNPASFNGFSLYSLDAAQRAQKWLQKALFFGNRISDFYYMRFGVRFLDARLRLPELLTSSSELVKLDVVMNNTNITTEANGEVFRSIAGDRAAYASAYDNGNSFDRFCEEHGVIMSYLTIMPQVTYAYGRNRDYSRIDQFDYAFSEFATLGMDAVYSTEITTTSLDLSYNTSDEEFVPQKIFGYQGRYYDYKAKHSEEHGELLDSQDMYTFARKFNMLNPNGYPKLNYEFVHCFPDLDMFVVDSKLADYFRYDIRHSTAAERELPSQSIYI